MTNNSPGEMNWQPSNAVEIPRQDLSQSSAEAAGPLTEFPKFQKLPAEIRIKIWKFASYHRRCIVITAHIKNPPFENTPESPREFLRHVHSLMTFTPPVPAIFQVNKEARYEAKLYYQPMFNNKIHINPVHDTVIFVKSLLDRIPSIYKESVIEGKNVTGAESVLLDCLGKIENICILDGPGSHSYHKDNKDFIRRVVLSRMTALRTISFLLAPDGMYWAPDTDNASTNGITMLGRGISEPLEGMVWTRAGYQPKTFSTLDWKAVDRESDLMGFSELKRHTVAIENDYELEWDESSMTAWRCKGLMKKQKDRIGNGKGPDVQVYRYKPE